MTFGNMPAQDGRPAATWSRSPPMSARLSCPMGSPDARPTLETSSLNSRKIGRFVGVGRKVPLDSGAKADILLPYEAIAQHSRSMPDGRHYGDVGDGLHRDECHRCSANRWVSTDHGPCGASWQRLFDNGQDRRAGAEEPCSLHDDRLLLL